MRRELSVFYRQAGTASRAGIPLTQGLRLAASGERGSEHPLAAAIVEGAEARGIKPAAADKPAATPTPTTAPHPPSAIAR